jgi:hypothetical protein
MEPFKTSRGEQAALRAATQTSTMSPEEVVRASGPLNSNNTKRNAICRLFHTCCVWVCLPFLWLTDCFFHLVGDYVCRCCNRFYQMTKRQANLCLNGKQPWVYSVRITSINVVVLCSTWYMFSDQLRLAFFPASADFSLAVINLVVWCILMAELLFELFIRPDGFQDLIVSDKAYAPTTVRFINAFHLIIESASLFCFIPEFYCLFSGISCSKRLDFSFFNAALMGVTGPSRLEFFYGKAFFALIRLRVFGLVRHWKKMWINNTFINMRWKAAHGFFSGSSSKQGISHQKKQYNLHNKSKTGETCEEAKKKESVLTNASNIGTALMVTNSYRVLLMLVAIVGIFPVLASLTAKSTINRIATDMTDQLQATNLLVTDNSNTSCMFLRDSIVSWVTALTPSDRRSLYSTRTNVFLLSLSMEPDYCRKWLDQGEHTSIHSETFADVLHYVCRMKEHGDHNETVGGENGRNLLDQTDDETRAFHEKHCTTWKKTRGSTSPEEISSVVDVRAGAINVVESWVVQKEYTVYQPGGIVVENATYVVTAVFNDSYAMESA